MRLTRRVQAETRTGRVRFEEHFTETYSANGRSLTTISISPAHVDLTARTQCVPDRSLIAGAWVRRADLGARAQMR